MRRKYISPLFKEIMINSPMLMLDVSRAGGQTDTGDSDKSKSFWGSDVWDDTEDSFDN